MAARCAQRRDVRGFHVIRELRGPARFVWRGARGGEAFNASDEGSQGREETAAASNP
jgi:hypothetical protein